MPFRSWAPAPFFVLALVIRPRPVGLSKAWPPVALTVSRDGRSKTLTRSFRVE